ncbi:MAG: response regulator [Pseudomonadota bacterium]
MSAIPSPILTPEEALTYLTGAKGIFPDLILLDINMPRMDGFEFLDAATEALGEAFATVVVMLTTSMDPTDEARAATYGAVRSYVNKPLDHKKLTQVVSLV